MKRLCEIGAESGAAIAAILWFISARMRLSKGSKIKRGLASGIDDPRQVLLLVYQQSRWSAWAAIAAGRLRCSRWPMDFSDVETLATYERAADAFLSGSISSSTENGFFKNAMHPEFRAASRTDGVSFPVM